MEDAVIARLIIANEKFELLVDPELALNLKHGQKVSFSDLLAIDSVFKDAKKGESASEEMVKKVFGTIEIESIAKKICAEGEVQLTTEQRRKMLEQRRREIVSFIAKNCINPQTKTIHPAQRIENAMVEAKIQVDLFKTVKEQLPDIIKALKRLLPISMEQLTIELRIPAQFAGKANFLLHKYNRKKEEWKNDGSLSVTVEIPAGLKMELFNELSNLTHGAIESKIIE